MCAVVAGLYGAIFLAAAAGSVASETMFVAQMAFYNRVADPAIGGTYMSPVVAPPQVAIGAIGAARRVPRFAGDSDAVVAATVANVSWAADHRVVDGATMAGFSNAVKELLEDPTAFLKHLK